MGKKNTGHWSIFASSHQMVGRMGRERKGGGRKRREAGCGLFYLHTTTWYEGGDAVVGIACTSVHLFDLG